MYRFVPAHVSENMWKKKKKKKKKQAHKNADNSGWWGGGGVPGYHIFVFPLYILRDHIAVLYIFYEPIEIFVG